MVGDVNIGLTLMGVITLPAAPKSSSIMPCGSYVGDAIHKVSASVSEEFAQVNEERTPSTTRATTKICSVGWKLVTTCCDLSFPCVSK